MQLGLWERGDFDPPVGGIRPVWRRALVGVLKKTEGVWEKGVLWFIVIYWMLYIFIYRLRFYYRFYFCFIIKHSAAITLALFILLFYWARRCCLYHNGTNNVDKITFSSLYTLWLFQSAIVVECILIIFCDSF